VSATPPGSFFPAELLEQLKEQLPEALFASLSGTVATTVATYEGKRVSNPPSQAAEPVVKCGYGSSDERSPDKTTDTGRDSADCGGVCN
jgi:hypothetical protein